MFGADIHTDVVEHNGVCQDCHDDGDHADWEGSEHGFADLACTDCHQVHAVQDLSLIHI